MSQIRCVKRGGKLNPMHSYRVIYFIYISLALLHYRSLIMFSYKIVIRALEPIVDHLTGYRRKASCFHAPLLPSCGQTRVIIMGICSNKCSKNLKRVSTFRAGLSLVLYNIFLSVENLLSECRVVQDQA